MSGEELTKSDHVLKEKVVFSEKDKVQCFLIGWVITFLALINQRDAYLDIVLLC